jgi:hypothetical protein
MHQHTYAHGSPQSTTCPIGRAHISPCAPTHTLPDADLKANELNLASNTWLVAQYARHARRINAQGSLAALLSSIQNISAVPGMAVPHPGLNRLSPLTTYALQLGRLTQRPKAVAHQAPTCRLPMEPCSMRIGGTTASELPRDPACKAVPRCRQSRDQGSRVLLGLLAAHATQECPATNTPQSRRLFEPA